MTKKNKESQHEPVDAGSESKSKSDVGTSDNALESLQQELDMANDALLRLKAEYANYQRRTEEEKKATYTLAVADVMKSIVDVFDDFRLALSHNQDGEEFRKGMELIFAKLYQMAEDKGLEKVETEGVLFNPNIHEVMFAEESDKPSQTVLEELQPGYILGGKVLRHAKVKVAK